METFSHLSSKSRSCESFFHDGVDPLDLEQQEHDLMDEIYDTPQHNWFKNLEESVWENSSSSSSRRTNSKTNKKKKNQVFLEGYVENSDEDELGRTKSLTDDDLEELKGCLDLGFGGFSYDEIPELCNTLPALELCYSMSQKYLDEQQKSPDSMSDTASSGSGPVANWKISSPGDDPEDVKARLKYWAQAVACTVKLCN